LRHVAGDGHLVVWSHLGDLPHQRMARIVVEGSS
jgi:hypothetical protein